MSGGKEKDDVRCLRIVAALALALAPSAAWAQPAAAILRQHAQRRPQYPRGPGLVTFIAIVGISAGATLLAQLMSKEIDSSVPWVGFPVGYAVSGVLFTVFGYFAMLLAK